MAPRGLWCRGQTQNERHRFEKAPHQNGDVCSEPFTGRMISGSSVPQPVGRTWVNTCHCYTQLGIMGAGKTVRWLRAFTVLTRNPSSVPSTLIWQLMTAYNPRLMEASAVTYTTHTHMNVHTHTCACMYTHAHTSTHIQTHACTHMHTYSYPHVHAYIHTHVCIYRYIHTHMHAHTCTCTHTHTHATLNGLSYYMHTHMMIIKFRSWIWEGVWGMDGIEWGRGCDEERLELVLMNEILKKM